MQVLKLLDRIKEKAFLHPITWMFFGLAFFLTISVVQSPEMSLKIMLAMFLPSVPAVYLHLRVFIWFLKKQNFLLYMFILVGIVFAFGKLINLVAMEWVFPEDDNLYIAGELVVAVFITVSTCLKYFFVGLSAQNKLIEIEAKQHKAELDSLRSQVNPHFLFNSLNNIYGLMEEDVNKAGESLLTLSTLLRYLIYSSQKTSIKLQEEMKFVEDYIAMERLRLGEKCCISFEKTGDFSNCMLPPFLLMPFVENAFKHGSFATIKESFVRLSVMIEKGTLSFQVQNSKRIGRPHGDGGVGITNVKRRLDLMLPDKHTLDVVQNEDDYTVNLTLVLTC